ncbi:hypothetical protein PW5551_01370 [Petrotoga sp. 9PW.55.5.1]|uniref:DUF5693 family protein n=1 Tax=Petrotoga sp. 9PW.55.5.1 TaxID=1308979 RepID=UPI000DC47635|nr:DUF5693 family protein [Petrotoga sp. 9PW.55.5.1]RAO99858.1 hypothetical protein PW5551_01370 [Petrotoga sp. 9PW.55.5.1]
MKEIRKPLLLITLLCVLIFFFYAFYVDYQNSKNYAILPIENQLQTINQDGYSYYTYQNYAILKDFESQGFEIDKLFLKDLVNKYDYILVTEFSDFDKYFTDIKDKLDVEVLSRMRYLHYIKSGEIDKFDNQMIVQRFHRALNERKIRYFLFPDHPRTPELISLIQKDLGTPVTIDSIKYNSPVSFIPWLGFILISLNLFAYIPLFSVFYILAFLFLYNWSFTIAATLFSIIIFFRISKNNLLKILGYSLLFGILVFMSGYNDLFIFKLNNVRGVKILLVVLPLLVLLKAFRDFTGFTFSKTGFKNAYQKILSFKFHKKDIVLLFLLIFAGVIYIIRSSNWAFVSNLERRIRDSLERALIARPRTKELISYFFYYTAPLDRRDFIWDLFKAILPVSILDTFLHIHTPLNLSVLRTINGFLVSLLLLLIIILFENYFSKFKTKHKNYEKKQMDEEESNKIKEV